MDCGVAALASFASAYGCTLDYGRLREACQTGVDGTSIDSLEDVANVLGIEVVQHIVPRDLFLDAMQGRFPFLTVVKHSSGAPHFVVVWRQVGPFVQLMNPAGGREWMLIETFLGQLHEHGHRMARTDLEDWWPTSSFAEALDQRLARLLSPEMLQTLGPFRASRRSSEVAIADASARLVSLAHEATDTAAGRDALFAVLHGNATKSEAPLSALFPTLAIVEEASSEGEVELRGVVALAPFERHATRVRTATKATTSALPSVAPAVRDPAGPVDVATIAPAVMARALAAADGHTAQRGLVATLWEMLDRDHRMLAMFLLVAALLFSPIVLVETFVFRAALESPRMFDATNARVAVSVLVLSFFALVFGLEALAQRGSRKLGTFLEMTLRLRVLEALPNVDDQFVRSRPTTDLAYRAHALSQGRTYPSVLLTIARTVIELLVSFVAVAYLEPRTLPILLVGGAALALTTYSSASILRRFETRFQTHASRLLTLFLDALRGIRPVRTHGFQRAFRTEYGRELRLWEESVESRQQASASFEAFETLVGILVVSGCLYSYVRLRTDVRGFVLLAFWVLRVPLSVKALVDAWKVLPHTRLSLSRLLEVTQSATSPSVAPRRAAGDFDEATTGMRLRFRDVSVVVGGHVLLEPFTLEVHAGQHVAIVGPSGAGKSSLLDLVLGFLRPASGEIQVGDAPLDAETCAAFRSVLAWVDPSSQLLNRSLIENVEYAATDGPRHDLTEVMQSSDLMGVLDALPEGMGTKIGWDGNALSGGEGQRVRIARALLRGAAKIAILDEPFRGLDQETRRRLLAAARRLWGGATVLFASHDISHALDFDRVIVVENGKIVEDGNPEHLRHGASRFAALLEAEGKARRQVWNGGWRKLYLERGLLREDGPP